MKLQHRRVIKNYTPDFVRVMFIPILVFIVFIVFPINTSAECAGGTIIGKTSNGQTFDTGVPCSLSNPSTSPAPASNSPIFPTPSSGSGGGSSQDLFKFINESPDSSTGNQGTPAASGADTSDTGIHSLDQVGLGDTQTANTFTCGGGASGGSVANTLAGLGVNPSSVIACINGGSSCPGLAGNLAGNVLAQQAGKLGIPPGLVGTAIGVVSGNTSPTQAILGLAAQKAPAILQALFGGKGGAASAVGSALHSGAANSILGGAGGVVGIAAGVLGGGSSVPVNLDPNKKFLEDTAATRQFTEGLHTKETCTDGIAYDLAQAAGNRLDAATIKYANSQLIENTRAFWSTVDESVVKKFVNEEISDPALKQLVLNTYEQETSSKIRQSRNVSAEKSALDDFRDTFITEETPTPLSEYADALNELGVELNTTRGLIEPEIVDGLRSQVECLDRNGNPNGETRLELCGGNFRTVTHASVITDQLKNAVAAGPKRLSEVDEATKNVNRFSVQLFQQVFTNIRGLLSLSERGSAATPAPNIGGGGATPRPNAPGPGAASGDIGAFPGDAASGDSSVSPGGGVNDFGNNSSYLDQVAGTAENTSIASTRSFLTRNVSLSIAAEESYQRTLADMVQDVAFAAGAFDRVRLCYVDLTKNISTGISTATALEKANQASSTIAAIFVPQIERRVTEIAASELVVGELVRIAGLARDADTVDELNAASDSFDALLSAGLVHSEADLIFLDNDRQAAAVALQQVADEADAQLAECQQF